MKKFAIVFITLLAFIGLCVILYANSLAIGVSPDSVAYIASAGSLMRGDGLSIPTGIEAPIPMTHFAPLYPALLGILGRTGLDLNFLAKVFSAFLFSSSLFLAGYILLQCNRNFWLLAPFASLFLLVSEDMLTIHSYAWSEALFISLCMLGFFLFSHYLWEPASLKLITSLGVLAAAILTRYAGMAILPVVFIGALWFRNEPLSRRLLRSFGFTFICAMPALLWFARNLFVTGNLSDRNLVFHPISSADIRNGLDTISNWLLPGRISGTLRDVLVILFVAIVLILLSSVLFRNLRKVKNQGRWALEQILPTIFGLFCLSYLLLMIFTISFMDAQSTFNSRLLSPLLVSGLIAILASLPTYLKRISLPVQVFLGVLLCLVLAFNAVHSLKFITKAHDGSFKMYAGTGWQEAEIIRALRKLPEGIPIYSNGDDAVYYVTGKPAARFPNISDPFSSQENPNYHQELDQMGENIKERGGYIVCFSGMTWRSYLPDCEGLESIYSLSVLWSGDEGTIYEYGAD